MIRKSGLSVIYILKPTPTCDAINVTDTGRSTHPATLTNYINWINEDAINKGQKVKFKGDVPDGGRQNFERGA